MVINFYTTRKDHDALIYKSQKFNVLTELHTLGNYLDRVTHFGIDTEFNAKRFFLNDLLLVQLGDRENQFLLDWTDPFIRENAPNYLNKSNKLAIGQNLKSDIPILKRHGVNLPLIFDTFIAEKRLILGQPEKLANLTDIRIRRLHKQANAPDMSHTFMHMTWNSTFDIGQLLYGADDIEDLIAIATVQRDLLIKYKQYNFVRNVEFPLVPVLADMEIEGIYCDPVKWEKIILERKREQLLVERELDKELDRLFKRRPTKERKRATVIALDLFGKDSYEFDNKNVKHLNYASPKQVLKQFRKLNLPIPILKEKGRQSESVKESALQQYLIKYPTTPMSKFIDKLLVFKEHQKFISSYGQKFLKSEVRKKGKKQVEKGFLNPHTGKVVTEYKQCETDTGRLASGRAKEGKYNSQNLPAKKNVRECFGLTPQEIEEGWYITTCDLSQAELIIMAALANDLHLYELGADKIVDGKLVEGDLHSVLATKAWRAVYANRIKTGRKLTIKDSEDKEYTLTPDFTVSKSCNKQLRTDFKRMGFGVVYGLKPNKGSQTLNIPISDSEVVIQAIVDEIPATINMVEDAAACALTDGYVIFNERSWNRRWFTPVLNIIEGLRSDMTRIDKYNYVRDVLSSTEIADIEGAARNCRIQGTQADMIKEAHVTLQQYINKNKLNTEVKQLLSIHDEMAVKHKDKDFGKIIADTMTTCANNYLSLYSPTIKMRCEYHTLHTWTK